MSHISVLLETGTIANRRLSIRSASADLRREVGDLEADLAVDAERGNQPRVTLVASTSPRAVRIERNRETLEVLALEYVVIQRVILHDPASVMQAYRFARAWLPVDVVCSLPCIRLDELDERGR